MHFARSAVPTGVKRKKLLAIERLVPGTPEWELYFANHHCRYRFALEMLHSEQATTVLDAACGVGYGSKILGESALKVVAVDRDASALAIARTKFSDPNVRFVQDDCEQLASIANGAFDATVSFETLEHLQHPDRFLSRCHQSLKSGGILVISTPNGNLREGDAKTEWEFHENEYSAAEFVRLLERAGFGEIRLWGQQYTAIGRLRDQVRAELNRIHSNPFFRLGRLLQRMLRHPPPARAVLPESLDDFVLQPFSCAEELDRLGKQGPFVLVGIARNSLAAPASGGLPVKPL
jgi:2-polyprenyl-3-methyl-5-hydroxy-6-metoxy-1,4-benzoquinol methylase